MIMPTVAALLYAAFLAIAFGWRTWRQYRRTGDHGIRLFRHVGAVERAAQLALVLGVICAGVAPFAHVTGAVGRWSGLEHPWAQATGVVLGVAGIVAVVRAQLDMGESWRVGLDRTERTALVTSGLFQYVRNPIFGGVLLALTGLLLLVPNPMALAALILALVGVEVQVRAAEEPYLRRVHGDRYRTYTRNVGRFLPWIGRLQ